MVVVVMALKPWPSTILIYSLTLCGHDDVRVANAICTFSYTKLVGFASSLYVFKQLTSGWSTSKYIATSPNVVG